MKRKTSSESERANTAGEIPASHHYSGGFFSAVLPCASCGGKAREEVKEPALDEYEQVLADEAGRLVQHATRSMWDGNAIDAAGMLRDAARLLDLWEQRRRIRADAADALKAQRAGKAARS